MTESLKHLVEWCSSVFYFIFCTDDHNVTDNWLLGLSASLLQLFVQFVSF